MTILGGFVVIVIAIAVIAIAVWACSKIPWPAPLSWLSWAIPLVVMILALIWAAQRFGVA